MIKSKSKTIEELEENIYDAVLVCSGHYTRPRIAEFPGITTCKVKQIHSHNYRTPEPFRDQIAVLMGSSTSTIDISRNIAGVAKEIHIAARSLASETTEKHSDFHRMWLTAMIESSYGNIWLRPMIKSVHEDGRVVFSDGSVVLADIILHCTGYKYQFPFLDTNDIVSVEGDDNRVGPLFKHVFPPALAPSLSFVGIPYNTEYTNWLAEQCGWPATEEWRKQMRLTVRNNWLVRPWPYQDEWDDDHLVLQAYEYFRQNTMTGV